jgi:hypothetical protein
LETRPQNRAAGFLRSVIPRRAVARQRARAGANIHDHRGAHGRGGDAGLIAFDRAPAETNPNQDNPS